MAGDWIKMRNELWTHPKFIALANLLIYPTDDCGMLAYACNRDALQASATPSSNESVTDAALHHVTKRALRDVTMCALLRVWCAVNAHCKVVGEDAVCAPMGVSDLDDIAGFSGFGQALAAVGWVDHDEAAEALIFRNFMEFNEPAVLRSRQTKTNAERQAAFRARKKAQAGSNESNESNAREEKIREEEVTVVNDSVTPSSVAPPTAANPPGQGAASSKRATTGRGSRLPAEWVLPKAWGEWALQERSDLTAEDIRREAAVFSDHWRAKSGRDALKLDWLATWRNWVRRAKAARPPKSGDGKPPAPSFAETDYGQGGAL